MCVMSCMHVKVRGQFGGAGSLPLVLLLWVTGIHIKSSRLGQQALLPAEASLQPPCCFVKLTVHLGDCPMCVLHRADVTQDQLPKRLPVRTRLGWPAAEIPAIRKLRPDNWELGNQVKTKTNNNNNKKESRQDASCSKRACRQSWMV